MQTKKCARPAAEHSSPLKKAIRHITASLAETLYRYFAIDLDKSHRAKFNRAWDGIWTEELVDYALSDVVHLPELMREQSQWLEQLVLLQVFEEQIGKIEASFLK